MVLLSFFRIDAEEVLPGNVFLREFSPHERNPEVQGEVALFDLF
jgi:hypothetical protein